MTLLISLKAIIFLRSLSVVNFSIEHKDWMILQAYNTEVLICLVAQLVCQAWHMLFEKGGLRRLFLCDSAVHVVQ